MAKRLQCAVVDEGHPIADREQVLGVGARHQDGSADDYFRGRAPRTAVAPGPVPPVAFIVTYRDGLRATLLNLNGYERDFVFAARLRGFGMVR